MSGIVQSMHLPILLIIGCTILFAFYFGRQMKYIRMPSILGFMVLGALLGPSLLNIFDLATQDSLSFITEIALGFVALSIGMELRISTLKQLGKGIIYIILFESFVTFFVVLAGIYLLTGNIVTALIFGAIAPASAPAGTVAVIQEYKARGSLTKALYAVVGFDDGLGIIIFGFAAAIARSILANQTGGAETAFISTILIPFREVILSFVLGTLVAVFLSLLCRKLENAGDIIIVVMAFVLISVGLSKVFHLSLILTNMIIGMVIINTQSQSVINKIQERLPIFMSLLFILFFTLAGANLQVSVLPSLGLLGLIYTVTRTGGLVLGARWGAALGKSEKKIKDWVGWGILNQAGVAIGLALIVKHEFAGLGNVVSTLKGVSLTSGDILGATVITTVTATSIVFGIIGPIGTKIALIKAGEINQEQ